MNLSSDQTIYVALGLVRWVHGEEDGVETLVNDDESREMMVEVRLTNGERPVWSPR